MNFYTNVIQWGNNLLVRAVINDKREDFRVRYSPTLYAPVEKKTPRAASPEILLDSLNFTIHTFSNYKI